MKIEGLKKKLIGLSDTARVNCLNNLARAYYDADGKPIKVKADSGYQYALKANNEAVRLNYKKGIARSLLNFSN